MAGAFPGGDAAFREGIYFAMTMGSPTATTEKATFSWTKAQTFTPEDPGRRPYSWNQTVVTDTTPTSVVLDKVAVEFSDSGASDTNVGSFVPERATLTLLDTEYEQIKGADEVSLGGNRFDIRYVNTMALFSVTVYEIICERQ